MKPRVQEITIECADPRAMAEFWGTLLERPWGFADEPGGVVDAGDLFMLFQAERTLTPPASNRLHLDVEVDDLAAAVDRARGLGAAPTGEAYDDPAGGGYITLRDPEGNAFCLVSQPEGSWDALLRATLG